LDEEEDENKDGQDDSNIQVALSSLHLSYSSKQPYKRDVPFQFSDEETEAQRVQKDSQAV
jgi:hypothetical protein